MTELVSSLFLVLQLVALAHAFVVNTAQRSEASEWDHAIAERAAENPALRSVTRVGQHTVECDGIKYGDDLDLDSCEDALRGFADNRKEYTFGPASTKAQFTTPSRILSLDAGCYFDITQDNSREAVAIPFEFMTAANALVTACGKATRIKPHAIGGIVRGIGVGKHLSLSMGAYKPNVTCLSGSVDTIGPVVHHLLKLVPTSRERITFGHEPLTADVTQELPIEYPIHFTGYSIVAKVDVDGPPEVSSWYDIWASYTAISNLCLDNKKPGVARVGDHGRITVSIQAD